MSVLAIDIAFSNLGFAVISKGQLVGHGTIKTEKSKDKKDRASNDRASRAATIAKDLHNIIHLYDVAGIVGELPNGSQNAIAANGLGWACGVVVAVAECHVIPCEWISEGDSKKAAIGRRSASKDEMMEWARKEWPETDFPKAKCHFEHIADALAAYNGLRSGVVVRCYGQ